MNSEMSGQNVGTEVISESLEHRSAIKRKRRGSFRHDEFRIQK
jgi:hypothetical protein